MTTYEANLKAVENLKSVKNASEAKRMREDLRMDVLRDWKADKITDAELSTLRAMLADPAAPEKREGLYCKVSEKGALSVYGLQRMPVTLYIEQWNRLLAFVPELSAFAQANEGAFTTKADKVAAAEAAAAEKEAAEKAARKAKLLAELENLK